MRDTGGCAFPNALVYSTDADGKRLPFDPGMTLRDYFAAHALQGLLAEPQPEDGEPELGLGRTYAAKAAKAAYRLADAMIAERAK